MTTVPFTLTENAQKRVVFLLSDEPDGAFLRVSVDGGGCSGFQYKFDFDTEMTNEDKHIEAGDARVVIDDMSLEFVEGSVLDYVETLGASHFEVKNPNATANCGCGSSFAV